MRIVILTGAGISAESGVKTFRDNDGLWEGHDVQEVATPEAFARNPKLVQKFYDERRKHIQEVEPNAAHVALARLQQALPGQVTLVTQNVDDLHERGGSTDVIHMHGELLSALCTTCSKRITWKLALSGNPACPKCRAATLRPDIVWFGEMPYHMDQIENALQECNTFVAIGTSGVVYPAAGFAQVAMAYGAHTVEHNLDTSAISSIFDEVHTGPATQTVPVLVEQMIATTKHD